MLVRKCIRIPEEFNEFIQALADKQALLDDEKANWTKALINQSYWFIHPMQRPETGEYKMNQFKPRPVSD